MAQCDTENLYRGYIKSCAAACEVETFAFISPLNLKLIDGYKKTKWNADNPDPFLSTTAYNKTLLAEHIRRNGMYFPIFINSKNEVIMGSHRIESLQMAKDNTPRLCIILDDKHFKDDRLQQTWRGKEGPELLSTVLGLTHYGMILDLFKTIPYSIRNELLICNVSTSDLINQKERWENYVREVHNTKGSF